MNSHPISPVTLTEVLGAAALFGSTTLFATYIVPGYRACAVPVLAQVQANAQFALRGVTDDMPLRPDGFGSGGVIEVVVGGAAVGIHFLNDNYDEPHD
eukprot:CAMPEP_0115888632 /NCGR_PEP_ID=MMETSP0287-20121206/32407_1 /TAXON_ID=412157 /ORGANISM="Chrysochromulina rotalis, Strain UIO044" /LENGTH=97 /DNA_ID=CAMNT_0003345321 /DNA_START=73 /DNA_END=367 /DNA_ORIENTATION=+